MIIMRIERFLLFMLSLLLSSLWLLIKAEGSRISIRSSLPIEKQFLKEDCEFIINEQIDLGEKTIVIPNHSCLKFEGGGLSNGTIVGNHTSVIGNSGFTSTLRIEGTWINPQLGWYQIDKEGTKTVDFAFNSIISVTDSIDIPNGTYLLSKMLSIRHTCIINGNDATIISKTVDDIAAVSVTADSVRMRNIRIVCDNRSVKIDKRIHGFIVEGDFFYGSGISVINSNQNSFDIRGTGCVLESCDAINAGYAGFRTLNVLHSNMSKKDAWCKLLNCNAIGYGKKGFVNNGGMGILMIDGFFVSPQNESSEAAILLESSENSHNYEAYISNVEALGIWGNGIKQKAFERVVYKNCIIESRNGASLRLHPHRNTQNGERNAYVEIVDCKFTGARYCINGTNDVQSINYPDTLIVKDSELILKNGSRIIDVIKNNIFVINSKLIAKNNNSTALIVRSPNVTAVEIDNCEINANRVFGYSGKGKPFPQKETFIIKNTDFPDKIFGVSKYDFWVKVIK